MINFTFRQLALFEATARLGRLTLAAEEQAISQSAASQAIKELEVALKTPLFYRAGRELLLTHYGETQLPKIKQLLASAINLNSFDQNEVTGTLHFAVSATIGNYLLPRALPLFYQQFPNIKLDIQIKSSQQVIHAIEQGNADLGGIEDITAPVGIESDNVAQDHLSLFCAPHHPLASQGQVSKKDFSNQTWILREKDDSSRDLFDKEVYKLGASIDNVITFEQQEAVKQYVKAGLGVGCLSQLAIMEELSTGELITLKAPFTIKRKLILLHRPHAYRNPVASAFTEFLLANKGIGIQKLKAETQANND